jgi:3-oxoacyl-[acyl-carrier protein] reductase
MTTTQRRAFVSGASGDIGSAIAIELARQGYAGIAHAGGNRARAEAVAAEIRATGGSAEVAQFDVTEAAASRAALEALLEAGPIDALVHNAGVHHDAPMAGMTDTQWHRVIDVSLHGFFHLVQPLLLPMSRRRFGRIVAISSIAGVQGNRGQVNYAAAKSALHGAVKSLALEMGSRGLTANAVAPGLIAGAMAQASFDEARIKQLVPAGRAGTPQEVAALVAFLCGDIAAYINGQVIGVNGGMASA